MGEDGQKVSLGEVAAAWLSTREPTMFSCTSMDVPLIWRWLPKNLRTAPSTSQSHPREERCTDPWLVPVRCAVRPPRLRPKKRKRRRQEGPRGGSSTTADLSTSSPHSDARRDPTPTRNFPLSQSKICIL